jgi:hypothetical protein
MDLSKGDYLSAGFDVAGMAIPGVTGLGQLSKPIRSTFSRIFGKTHGHHLFPQQLRTFFAGPGRNIDVDDFMMKIPENAHTRAPNGIHTGKFENSWNGKWEAWTKKHPEATRQDCFKQLDKMKKDFEIENYPTK